MLPAGLSLDQVSPQQIALFLQNFAVLVGLVVGTAVLARRTARRRRRVADRAGVDADAEE